MTICIAAICSGNFVLTATDRKVTAGDIQFEPPQPKVWFFGPKIVALIAGDSDAQSEICRQVWRREPRSVTQAVHAYCRELGNYNRRQAERRVLFPLGLTMKSFLAGLSSMTPAFADQLRDDLARGNAEIETIICGVDLDGAHIYTVDSHGRAFCNTSIGFAAIGDGMWHASSQFMFAKYTPQWPLPRALSLVFTAKKHAEVAPGVGKDSDMAFA